MTPQVWVALILAILGVLNGPATQAIVSKLTSTKAKK